VTSNARINARAIRIVGGASISDPSLVNPYPVITGVAPTPDPFTDVLVAPTGVSSPCDFPSRLINESRTLKPGVYCGGISAGSKSDVNFTPGVYIIRGGDGQGGTNLHAPNSAKIRGSGVTFYFTCLNGPCSPNGTEQSRVLLQGSSDVRLSASNSGQYKGILFFQDRRLKSTENGERVQLRRCSKGRE
jgi:hypothetical protein